MLREIFKTKENQFMLALTGVSVVLITFGIFFLFSNDKNVSGPRKIPNSIEEINWKKFENKKYNFTVEYPEHFLFFEDYKNLGPVFNFYFEAKDSKPPLSNLVNESHISIYPMGVFEQGNTDIYYEQKNYINKNNIEFVLREYKNYSGKIWAIMAIPSKPPQNWKEWGFIWISAKIYNPSFRCFDGVIEISVDSCNTFDGDKFYKEGKFEDDIIIIGKEFLDRINFEY